MFRALYPYTAQSVRIAAMCGGEEGGGEELPIFVVFADLFFFRSCANVCVCTQSKGG